MRPWTVPACIAAATVLLLLLYAAIGVFRTVSIQVSDGADLSPSDDDRRQARAAGLSDGYYGYDADTPELTGELRIAYLEGHHEGRAKNRGGRAW